MYTEDLAGFHIKTRPWRQQKRVKIGQEIIRFLFNCT